jgi:predicted short-subunit dehydrogenase-like oxidoreductase (DUF2520 family)
MKPTLNIIGAGKVGKVLGQQFFRHHVFTVQDVMNRSAQSSSSACEFIGAGTPVSDLSALRPADIYLIAVPDDQIRACSLQLQHEHLIQPSSIMFHCSGALGSDQLELQRGAASLHPLRSFADPALVAEQFSGTLCTLEGDDYARRVLSHALNQIGAQVVAIKPESKTLYHAGAVFAGNYLVTLMDAAQQTLEAAGISGDMAAKMIEPLASEALHNAFRLGTRAALTGPIARGDQNTVVQHEAALKNWNENMAALYRELAAATLAMKQRS